MRTQRVPTFRAFLFVRFRGSRENWTPPPVFRFSRNEFWLPIRSLSEAQVTQYWFCSSYTYGRSPISSLPTRWTPLLLLFVLEAAGVGNDQNSLGIFLPNSILVGATV